MDVCKESTFNLVKAALTNSTAFNVYVIVSSCFSLQFSIFFKIKLAALSAKVFQLQRMTQQLITN